MKKQFKNKSILVGSVFFIFCGLSSHVKAESFFQLTEKENGVDGIVEISTINHDFSKIRILNKNNRILEHATLDGRDGRLDRIDGQWKNGPLFLVTTDLSIEMGSYNGPLTQPFQVIKGQIHWAKTENKKNELIHLVKTPKTGWKAKKILKNTGVEFLEIRCRPDFDHTPESAEEMKFELTYSRYIFDGLKWKGFSRSEEGCWEEGEGLPSRKLFL